MSTAREIEPIPPYINPDKAYRTAFHDAATRNATLERMATNKEIPGATLMVFADFIETFPTVPIKTRTDLGRKHRIYTYPEIISHFFSKIALDIQTSGILPTGQMIDMDPIHKLLEQTPSGNFTEEEHRLLRQHKIEPSVVPNLICARTLASEATKQGVHGFDDLPMTPIEEREDFAGEWTDAMQKIRSISALADQKVKENKPCLSVTTFAQCMRSYPFIPIKISSQTAYDRVPFDFDLMVAEFFEKLSQFVIEGEPVKHMAADEEEKAMKLLSDYGLTIEMLADSDSINLSKLERYNGKISPFTVPNLVTAHSLLRQYH